MKKFLLFSIAIITLSACQFKRGSGNIISEKRATGDFKGIAVGGDFDVQLLTGPVTEVLVEADDNMMNYVETRVSGDILKIGLRDLHNYGDAHRKVYITAPEITSIRASAAADVTAGNGLKSAGKLSFSSSSSGNISAEVDAPEIEVETSSASTVKLWGRTRNFHATASSGADVKAFDLLSENASVNASSGASARVHASLSLNANASSGANIVYRGSATLQKTVSSGGNVEKRN